MSAIDLSIWPEIRQYIVVEWTGGRKGDSPRIEVRKLPESLRPRVLAVTMLCAECGRTIHPFRERVAPQKRGKAKGNIYFAASCPLEVQIRCSRGKLATAEVRRIVRALGASRPSPQQLLF